MTPSTEFQRTRAEALSQWRAFLPRVADYARERNVVTTDNHGVSKLSPALRFGLLLREEIARDTLAHHSFEVAEKWLQEVYWRAYWKGWLEQRPQVWTSWRRRVAELHDSLPNQVLDRVEAVAAGRSGVAIMDYFADQLRNTGYLHNHARMWWASFWVHVERLPWELGAELFFQHLLDADPASNTLSWRWVAGLQTKGKAYLVRRSNLERWCRNDLLSDHQEGIGRIGDARVVIHIPDETPSETRQELPDLLTFVVQPHGRVGLWVHPDDACPEMGPLSELAVVATTAITSNAVYQQYGLSASRKAHLTAVLKDACKRCEVHFRCRVDLSEAPTTAEGLLTWASANELDHVVAMTPLVGPIADALPEIRSELQNKGVMLHLVRRLEDAQDFPLAKSGFFGFWKRIREARFGC